MRRMCLILVAALGVASAHGASLVDTLAKVRPAVVGVGKAFPPKRPLPKGAARITFSGTGFAVADGLHIITNHHVLPTSVDKDHMETLAVFSGRGNASRMHTARVVAVDEAHDLALLRISPPALRPLSLGGKDVREGQDIAITGFPIGVVLGLYPVTHKGIVAAIAPMARPAENAREISAAHIKAMRNREVAYQLDVVAYPGNSGSPVYEPASGKVIGVLNSVLVKTTRESLLRDPSGISYAIPVSYVRDLLQAEGISP